MTQSIPPIPPILVPATLDSTTPAEPDRPDRTAEPVALTPADLAAIRDRCHAAGIYSHPGPWEVAWASWLECSDKAAIPFIEQAPVDVPRLLDEVERLRAELTQFQAAYQRAQADLTKTAEDVQSVIDRREPETWAWPLHGLRDVVDEANERIEKSSQRVGKALAATLAEREESRKAQEECERLRAELDRVKADIFASFAADAVDPSSSGSP